MLETPDFLSCYLRGCLFGKVDIGCFCSLFRDIEFGFAEIFINSSSTFDLTFLPDVLIPVIWPLFTLSNACELE